ncbi:MAG: YARHG domain-containing protein [Bacteroidales bacterium]|nr:YARHG domain-containing protein [Bacteroidales bacterium]
MKHELIFLTDIDLNDKTLAELRIKRNEIFAKHGYIFISKDLSDHFKKYDWYKPKYKDVNHLLTKIDKQNISLIISFEKRKNIFPVEEKIIGQWLSKKYYDTLKKTMSARTAQLASSLSYVEFTKDKRSSIIINFHEGIDPDYYIRGVSIGFENFDSIDLKARIFDSNTIIFTSWGNIDTLKRFNVVDSNHTNLAINKVIFEGKYKDLINGGIIEFNQNGMLSGLNSFQNYKAFSDYFDVAANVDRLMLINLSEKLELTWTFKNDTLTLYDIKCAKYDSVYNTCYIIAKGNMLYKLLRIK